MIKLIICLIRIYQLTLSRILPQTCRFVPSCSQYTIDAMRHHGYLRGSILSIFRILRCQPLCSGGWDPVPPKGLRFADMIKFRHLCEGGTNE
ncbi:MAG: membrane protein insertion efficiency factor YidD [bacterium]